MLIAAVALLQVVSAQVRTLIVTGWDMPTPAELRKYGESFRSLPFDGAGIRFEVDGAPRSPFQSAFSRDTWDEGQFEPGIKDLEAWAAAPNRRLPRSLLTLNANPGDVDWFDDAGWKQIARHWRLAGEIVRRGKLAGVIFDPEPYTGKFRQFQRSLQPQFKLHSKAAYLVEARRRGREVMRAFAAEAPHATILCYYLFNQIQKPSADNQPYDLLPAFVDGWFDAMPSGITIVDGNESAYRYNESQAFRAATAKTRGENSRFLSPENRAKAYGQLKAGHGLYLDAYLNSRGNPWYIDGKGGSRLWRLAQNASDAFASSDGFVWIYGEQARWWPGGSKDKRWVDVLPDIADALWIARDPETAADRLSASGKDGLVNGDFSESERGWSKWQGEGGQGRISFSRGAATLSGVQAGCVYQAVALQPGQPLAVSAVATSYGNAKASLLIRWQDEKGKWLNEQTDRRFPLYSDRMATMVFAPVAARRAVVMGMAYSPSSKATDRVRFTRLKAVPFRP